MTLSLISFVCLCVTKEFFFSSKRQGSFKGVSRKFQGRFKEVSRLSRKFQGCFKDAVFQGSFKGVSRKFQGCFIEVSKVFQGRFKLSKFHEFFDTVLRKFM